MNAQMQNWHLVRSAYHVARLGTVSAAAEFLDMHHATVIRHIESLEDNLGAKLFQRHARGYVPTEAGRDLARVAATTEDQFNELSGRIRGRGAAVSGELVVTALAVLSSPITGWLARLQSLHPDLAVSLIADDRTLRLEYGEAHVAIRAGDKPQEPDNVVQHLISADNALYASRDYVDRMGALNGDDLSRHRFVFLLNPILRAPFIRWLADNVPDENIAFRASQISGLVDAMRAGIGIGPMSLWNAMEYPELVQVMAPKPQWRSDFWLVTHVDLHRTAKVQACLDHFKREARQVAKQLETGR